MNNPPFRARAAGTSAEATADTFSDYMLSELLASHVTLIAEHETSATMIRTLLENGLTEVA